jgi:hypothetical protein
MRSVFEGEVKDTRVELTVSPDPLTRDERKNPRDPAGASRREVKGGE